MVRILKSMPIVVMKDGVKESSLNLRRQQDLPTPESPMSSSFICCGSALTSAAEARDIGHNTHEKVVISCASHSGNVQGGCRSERFGGLKTSRGRSARARASDAPEASVFVLESRR